MLTRIFALTVLAPIFLFSYFLRALGLSGLNRAGEFLGGLFYAVGFRRKIVISNLELAFQKELKPQEIEALAKKIYQNIGCTFLGIARNFSLTKSQVLEEVQLSDADKDYIQKARQKGKGVILLSAHIANWELLAMGVAAHGFPVSVVVKKMSSAISQYLIERQRKRTGVEVIYAGGTIEKMRGMLAQGRVIGFMVDQNITGKRGVRCNFFGVPAASIRALGALIRDTGAPVIPICAFREPDGKLRVKILPELPYLKAEPGEKEVALREEWLSAQQYQAAVEALIRMHPEQWLWIHRRWKTKRDPLVAATAHLENA